MVGVRESAGQRKDSITIYNAEGMNDWNTLVKGTANKE